MSQPKQRTINELVARYQLRGRASSEAFTAGIRLADREAVSLLETSPQLVRAKVRDQEPYCVDIRVRGDELVGTCSCELPDESICRHQVAAAHTIWVRDRRRYGRR